jgi:hypothetical protein
MVTVNGYQLRKTEEGKEFFALILISGIEIIKSQTGGFYATAKKVSIPSTFNEETCKALIGEEMKGSIKSVKCEPYTFKIPETGEEIISTRRFEYFPEENILEDFIENLEKSNNHKKNGQLTH